LKGLQSEEARADPDKSNITATTLNQNN